MKFEALRTFLRGVLDVFKANNFPILNYSCQGNERTKRGERLFNDLSQMIEKNDLIYVDANLRIWLDLNFVVKTSSDNSSTIEQTATIDRKGVKPIGNHQIKQKIRFLRIGITESIPYTYYKRDPVTKEKVLDENGEPVYEGFCIDFIKELSRNMDFIFELVEPSSGKFGEKQSDGSFDGLIGDLARGETDIIVAALKMTADREEQIDFVAPYFDQTGIHIVMKKPIPDTSLFKFMTVLRLEVWLSILAALSITAIVIWILEIFSPYSSRNYNYAEECR